jgi:hypothetical protein
VVPTEKTTKNHSNPDQQCPVSVIPLFTTGASHQRKWIERQDSYGYRWIDEAMLLAVTDGHGSHPLSAIGSALAIDTFMEVGQIFLRQDYDTEDPETHLQMQMQGFRNKDMFAKSLVNVWREKVNKRYEDLCQSIGYEIPEETKGYKFFGTTLLGAIIVFDQFTVLFGIGDGNIYIASTEDEQPQPAFLHKKEFGLIGSEVHSLTSPAAHENAQIDVLFSIPSTIILASDGMEDAFINDEKVNEAFHFFSQHTRPDQILDLPYLHRRLEEKIGPYSGDDITLLIAHST